MGWFEDLSKSVQSQTSGIRVAPETALEQFANPMLQRQLQGFEGLVNAGPGNAQMQAGVTGMEDYAKMLGNFSSPQGLFAAQQQGIDQYSKLGDMIFGGQMRQQQQEAQRLAGRLGRPTNDPILQAKLAQQRSDTVGAFAAQQSMALPGQLAQFGGQRAEVLQGLASQAMANRLALLGMGSQLREQDRGYRINTGERYSTQTQDGSFLSSLGGIAGIAGTALQGFGQLKNAGNYQRLVDQQLSKGAAPANALATFKDSTGGMSNAQLSQAVNAEDPFIQANARRLQQQTRPMQQAFSQQQPPANNFVMARPEPTYYNMSNIANFP